MLWRALRTVETGCYVDVGAAEPVADSVTYAFYLRGWRGVNLEPTPGAFQRLSEARPDDVNLNVAAGDRDGTATLFLVDGGNGLSTSVPDQAETLRHQGWRSSEIRVPMRRLASIVDEHVRRPVHFLKVDTEGNEREVLAGSDLRRFRPWVVLVEATAPNSQTPTHELWEDLLLGADYRFVWFDGLNRFYVAAEHGELAAAFRAPPNVFDGYVRHAEAQAKEEAAKLRSALADAEVREQQAASAFASAQADLRSAQAAVQQAQAGLRSVQAELGAGRERVAALEAETARLSAEAAAGHGRAEALRAENARIAEERDGWAQEMFETNRHAAHLAQVRQVLSDEVGALRDEAARLQQHLHAVYASTSWRVAWPVRAVARVLKRG